LCDKIKKLPEWTLPPKAGIKTEALISLYDSYPNIDRLDIEGLILLLNSKALCGEYYPKNIEDFATAFHVQENNFSYLVG
jgi:hypothetical protein